MSELSDQPIEIRAPWRVVHRRTTKVAFSLKELVALTSDFSLKWAKDCDSTIIRTDPKKFLFVFRVTCHKKDSDAAGHVVRLKFDFTRMKKTGTVDDLDVRVTCSCPAFLYWGAQWNLSGGDALYGAPRPKFQPPTDPKRYQNVICKHIKIVEERIGPALERMLAKYQNATDRATQDQRLKDVELEKERTQQTIDELNQRAPEKLPAGEPEPEIPETAPETHDDLGDLALPHQRGVKPKINPETLLPQSMRDFLKLPAVPKAPTPPEAPKPSAPLEEKPKDSEPPTKPEAPQDLPPGDAAGKLEQEQRSRGKKPTPSKPAPVEQEGAPTPKGKLVQEHKGRQVTPNLTVFDDEDDSTTVLPGNKGKLVREFKKQEAPKPQAPAKPNKVVRDESATGKPLPSNITLVDDDDDSTVRINSSLRRMLASLIMAGAEPTTSETNK